MAFISLNDFTFDPEVNNLKLEMKQWTAEFIGKTQYNWRILRTLQIQITTIRLN